MPGLYLSWLEERSHKPTVPGSSPGGPTTDAGVLSVYL